MPHPDLGPLEEPEHPLPQSHAMRAASRPAAAESPIVAAGQVSLHEATRVGQIAQLWAESTSLVHPQHVCDLMALVNTDTYPQLPQEQHPEQQQQQQQQREQWEQEVLSQAPQPQPSQLQDADAAQPGQHLRVCAPLPELSCILESTTQLDVVSAIGTKIIQWLQPSEEVERKINACLNAKDPKMLKMFVRLYRFLKVACSENDPADAQVLLDCIFDM